MNANIIGVNTEPLGSYLLDELTAGQLQQEILLIEAEIKRIEGDLEEIDEKRAWLAACNRRLVLKGTA
jgi:hypothetical protein